MMTKKHYSSGYKFDRTGLVYGLLTVLRRLPGKNYWQCECECGNKEVRVQGQRLSCGEKTHCGCQADKTHKCFVVNQDHPIIDYYLKHYKPEALQNRDPELYLINI